MTYQFSLVTDALVRYQLHFRHGRGVRDKLRLQIYADPQERDKLGQLSRAWSQNVLMLRE